MTVARARNGSEEVLATIAPLMAVAALAKQTIRCERVCASDASAQTKAVYGAVRSEYVCRSGVVEAQEHDTVRMDTPAVAVHLFCHHGPSIIVGLRQVEAIP